MLREGFAVRRIFNDYHDYVFKDGKFVGLFDEMYKYSKEIPWHQDKVAFKWFTQIGILIVKDVVREKGERFSAILEMGCGLGYFISQLKPHGERLYGCDISPTAIEKARDLHKGVDFFIWDIAGDEKLKKKYDLTVMIDVIWYVLDRLENIKRNVFSLLPNGGYFLFKQSFPDLNKPYVGKNLFPDPKSMINFWNDFEMIYCCEIKKILDEEGPHIWFLGRKR